MQLGRVTHQNSVDWAGSEVRLLVPIQPSTDGMRPTVLGRGICFTLSPQRLTVELVMSLKTVL